MLCWRAGKAAPAAGALAAETAAGVAAATAAAAAGTGGAVPAEVRPCSPPAAPVRARRDDNGQEAWQLRLHASCSVATSPCCCWRHVPQAQLPG